MKEAPPALLEFPGVSLKDLPIVGKDQFTAYGLTTVCMLRCNCSHLNKPMTLHGVNGKVQCATCGLWYFIVELYYQMPSAPGEPGINRTVIAYDDSEMFKKEKLEL